MKKDRKQAAAALIAAACVMAAGAAEAVDSRTAEHDGVEYRFWLADWLRAFWR